MGIRDDLKILKMRPLVAARGTLLGYEHRAAREQRARRIAGRKQASQSVVGAKNPKSHADNCSATNRKNYQKGVHSSITFTSSHLDVSKLPNVYSIRV